MLQLIEGDVAELKRLALLHQRLQRVKSAVAWLQTIDHDPERGEASQHVMEERLDVLLLFPERSKSFLLLFLLRGPHLQSVTLHGVDALRRHARARLRHADEDAVYGHRERDLNLLVPLLPRQHRRHEHAQ